MPRHHVCFSIWGVEKFFIAVNFQTPSKMVTTNAVLEIEPKELLSKLPTIVDELVTVASGVEKSENLRKPGTPVTSDSSPIEEDGMKKKVENSYKVARDDLVSKLPVMSKMMEKVPKVLEKLIPKPEPKKSPVPAPVSTPSPEKKAPKPPPKPPPKPTPEKSALSPKKPAPVKSAPKKSPEPLSAPLPKKSKSPEPLSVPSPKKPKSLESKLPAPAMHSKITDLCIGEWDKDGTKISGVCKVNLDGACPAKWNDSICMTFDTLLDKVSDVTTDTMW
jgi:hypothetical protein